jgi:hypothetical protein
MILRVELGSASARLALLATMLLVLACAPKTRIVGREPYEGEKLPRPDRILVYDFAARAADLPPWSEAAKTYQGREAAATDDEVEVARKLGYQMTKELVSRIDEMGLTVKRSIDPSEPQPGDIALVGFLGSVDEGSGFKRVVLGFGSGAPEITSHLEGYLATEEGFRKLGSGRAQAGKKKTPGAVVPIIVAIVTKNPIGLIVTAPIKITGEMTGRTTLEGAGEQMAEQIAKELEPRFREQGWLED